MARAFQMMANIIIEVSRGAYLHIRIGLSTLGIWNLLLDLT
jgi:hypothetical protein